MNILAVETSSFDGTVAVSADRQVLEQRALSTTGRRHAQTLVFEVAELLAACRLPPAQIDAVAVSIGPGSFTGLRVGVVFAKTFAWANHAKLVAVDTLQAIAQQVPVPSPVVTVISDAQREEVFVNRYVWDAASQARQPAGKLQIVSVDRLADSANAAQSGLLTGPGLEKFGDRFPDAWQRTAVPLTASAAAVAEIGSLMLASSEFANIHTLEPLYVRRSYAEEKRSPAGNL